MSGLVLSLKADEKFLVNGALVQNGPKRAQIRLPDSSVNVLRLSDVLHPDEINTPVKRTYYFAQTILSGDLSIKDGKPNLLNSLQELALVFENTPLSVYLQQSIKATENNRFYSVLNILKNIIPIETEMLANKPSLQKVG